MISTPYVRRALAFGLMVATAACHETSSPSDNVPAALTALPRALTADEQQVLGAANAFSFSLWNRLNAVQRDSNVFVSPLSASFALGMTMSGAANLTFDQMRTALGFGTATSHEINEGYRSLISLLTSLDPAVTTTIANSIWYRNTFTFNQTFFDTAHTYFDAEVAALNFANAPASLATINGWVNTKTNGKIPTILDQINDADVMYLINAIYFNAQWREKFDADETTDAQFHGAAGSTQSMRLMHRKGDMRYTESPSWQAVDLPYGNTAFTMTVVLPKEGNDVESVAASLTPSSWASLTGAFIEREVDLSMPKLKLSYERTLNDDLKALGMIVPFVGDAADFTRMSPAGNHLFISFVKQKTYVDIHEEGTEAAAVTAVGITVTSAPVIPVMRIDRPYIFVIRERLSGAVLFMGKIVRIPATS